MQIIINILAGIGFLTVLGLVWVLFELMKEKQEESKRKEKNGRKSEQK